MDTSGAYQTDPDYRYPHFRGTGVYSLVHTCNYYYLYH